MKIITENYYGIKVNINALADGLVSLIKEHPDRACFMFGMFPNDIMEAFEKELKAKIPDTFYSKETGDIHDNGEDIRKDITQKVCAAALADPMVIV